MIINKVECWACHQKIWITPFTYIVCGECGHPYTKRSLIKDDYAVRMRLYEMYKDESEPCFGGSAPEKQKAEDIFCCPCCVHDF